MKTDKDLEQKVQEALRCDPKVEHSRIGVTVNEGVVWLRGTVPNTTESWEAERVAKHVAGVKSVVNHLEVLAPDVTVPTDGPK